MATRKQARVRLIHWNERESASRKRELRALGHAVESGPLEPPTFRGVRDDPPDAFVIDLTRLPSHGREVGHALRSFKDTRHVPLVFAGGAEDKVARVRQLLPDATFTTWEDAGPALQRALAAPPVAPVVPKDRMAGYSGTPLPRKLGIKPGMKVGLMGAPANFATTLGELPEGASLAPSPRGACELVLLFATSVAQLEKRLPAAMKLMGSGGLWLAWPKQASGVATDLREPDVRRIGLASGLVDYKVCAIDAIWSGLKFARRGGS